jgi:hypothetical protein
MLDAWGRARGSLGIEWRFYFIERADEPHSSLVPDVAYLSCALRPGQGLRAVSSWQLPLLSERNDEQRLPHRFAETKIPSSPGHALDGNEPPNTRAHHIHPYAWCGSNATSNGVFLENTPHQQFTNWFQPFSAFTPYGKIDGSGADCKTATPVDTTTTR